MLIAIHYEKTGAAFIKGVILSEQESYKNLPFIHVCPFFICSSGAGGSENLRRSKRRISGIRYLALTKPDEIRLYVCDRGH